MDDDHCATGHACHGAACCGPAAEMQAAAVAGCCAGGVPAFDGMDPRYRRVLWLVIGINGAMFAGEMLASQLAVSQALKADALDFLADTVTYGLSLAVIGAPLGTRAMAALVKGASLSLMALWVFGTTIYHTLILGLPRAELMGAVALLALAANLASVLLLRHFKDGDANVRSVWLCSRNDTIGNVAVLGAALAVWGSTSAWPDLVVAALMAGIFLASSVSILRQAWWEHHGHTRQQPAPAEQRLTATARTPAATPAPRSTATPPRSR